MIEQSRRGFITGLISFAATAPAIVRAISLMPVKVMGPELAAAPLEYNGLTFWIEKNFLNVANYHVDPPLFVARALKRSVLKNTEVLLQDTFKSQEECNAWHWMNNMKENVAHDFYEARKRWPGNDIRGGAAAGFLS